MPIERNSWDNYKKLKVKPVTPIEKETDTFKDDQRGKKGQSFENIIYKLLEEDDEDFS